MSDYTQTWKYDNYDGYKIINIVKRRLQNTH